MAPETGPTPPPPGDWLAYVNYYRAMAGLPAVAEDATWSNGCWLHSRYCVKEDEPGHYERPESSWYTPEGATAGGNGNVMASGSSTRSDEYAIDMWMSGPFHALGIIDPRLEEVGFGSYREAAGWWQMAATLDVLRGLGSVPPTVTFPIYYPIAGSTTYQVSYNGSEWPDPLSSCSGYSAPSGPPILLQLGSYSVTPDVTAHSFSAGGTPLDHCVYDETTYTNPDSYQQSQGRAVLNMRDAIALIPRLPLAPGTTYDVSITTNSQTYAWSFTAGSTTVAGQPEPAVRDVMH